MTTGSPWAVWSALAAPTPRAFAVLYVLLALTPLLALAAARDLRGALKPTRLGAVGFLAALVLVGLAIARLPVPGPWSTNNHDFGTLASIEFGAWDAPAGLGEVHGFAPVALLRALRALTFDALSTPLLASGVALVTTALVGAVAMVASGRPEVGIAAVLLFGLHPALLRLAPTPSPFVPFVGALAAMLLAVECWLVSVRTASLLLAFSCGLIALQCRGEAFAIVPLCGVAWIATRRRHSWRQTLPPARLGLLLLGSALLLLPRLALFQEITAVTGVPMFTSRGGVSLVQNAQRVAPLGLVAKAVSVGLLAATVGWALRLDRPPVWARRLAPVLVVVGVYGVLRHVLPPDGHDPGFAAGGFTRVPETWQRFIAVHGVTDPRLTDPMLVAVALVGVTLVALTSTADGLLLLVCVAVSLLPYVGAFDTFATVTRTSLAGVATFSVAASAALAIGAGPWSRGLTPLLALGLAAYALGPRVGWVSYAWPMQQEYAILAAAADRTDPSPRVILGVRDVPPGVDPGTWDWIYRGYAPDLLALSGVPVVPVQQALADPEAVVGGLWVRSLACARGVFVDPVQTPGVPIDRWLIDGRPMEFSPFWLRPGKGDDMDLDLALPCWRTPWTQVCLDPDEQPCTRWTCDAFTVAQTLGQPGYQDPMCRAMEERFVLELVEARVVADGNLSGPFGVEVDPNALVGTWRITGVRTP